MPSWSIVQGTLNHLGFHINAIQWLSLWALVFARVTAVVVFAPFLGGQSVPGTVKVGLSFALSVVLLPALTGNTATLPPAGMVFLALLVKEAVIGATIGFLSQLVFYGVQIAGTIVDTQRGLNQVTFLAPQLEGHPSALGAVQFQAALALFFALQGHLAFIGALMNSFRQLPILEIPRMTAGIMTVAELAARDSANALLLGCQIAAPVVLAIFLVDVAFASAGRVASQIRINQEAFTSKGLVGLAFVCLLTATFLDQLRPAFAGVARGVGRFIDLMR